MSLFGGGFFWCECDSSHVDALGVSSFAVVDVEVYVVGVVFVGSCVFVCYFSCFGESFVVVFWVGFVFEVFFCELCVWVLFCV